jgi:NAD(P)-dependent dehydrogenase (short-subunit alcohol dehydrogenase family)
MFRPGLLAGCRVLITGGGSGLGHAIGRRFLELGADLVVCGRRAPALDDAATLFRAGFPSATVDAIGCDVRDPAQVEEMLDRIWQDRPLDVLVNNEAANLLEQSHELSVHTLNAVLGSVLHGAAYCTLGCGRRWIDAGHSGTVLSIVMEPILSEAAFTLPSAIAKAGVLAMMQGLAMEWGPKGVSCVMVTPDQDGGYGNLADRCALLASQTGRVPTTLSRQGKRV